MELEGQQCVTVGVGEGFCPYRYIEIEGENEQCQAEIVLQAAGHRRGRGGAGDVGLGAVLGSAPVEAVQEATFF